MIWRIWRICRIERGLTLKLLDIYEHCMEGGHKVHSGLALDYFRLLSLKLQEKPCTYRQRRTQTEIRSGPSETGSMSPFMVERERERNK